jgi:pentose-5-phosphate-3-epimerase
MSMKFSNLFSTFVQNNYVIITFSCEGEHVIELVQNVESNLCYINLSLNPNHNIGGTTFSRKHKH